MNETKVITGKVRFSYLHVWEPWAGTPGQEPKYSVCLLIPKLDFKTSKAIDAAIKAATEQGAATKWGGKVPKNLHIPLRDGDTEKDGEEFTNMYFLNANSKRRPGVVDRNRQDIIDRDELKSGDWGVASITFFPYSASGNNGIGVSLNNIMKLQDGQPLGGSVASAEEDFKNVDLGEDDDDDLLS